MTTNKPEVVAYLHTDNENPKLKGVSLHHRASCTSTLISTEPLIRLSDYEALQAEREKLLARVEELEKTMAAIKAASGYRWMKGISDHKLLSDIEQMTNNVTQAAELDIVIDAAMQEDNPC